MRNEEEIFAFIRKTLPEWKNQILINAYIDPLWFSFRYRHGDSQTITVDKSLKLFHPDVFNISVICGMLLFDNDSKLPVLSLEQVVDILKKDKLKHRLEVL